MNTSKPLSLLEKAKNLGIRKPKIHEPVTNDEVDAIIAVAKDEITYYQLGLAYSDVKSRQNGQQVAGRIAIRAIAQGLLVRANPNKKAKK